MASSSPSAPPPSRLRWLEISPGYACNCRCLGCYSCSADGKDQMEWPEVSQWLQKGRRMGARHLWLSGGEPTLRKDFLAMLQAARQLGYQRIKVQTNGMLFSYEHFVAKAKAAGMTEVNLLLKSLDPKVHDALNRTPGSHALLDKAVDVLAKTDLRLEGDVLLTTRNAEELPRLVQHYAQRGLRHFNFWLFSLVDQGDRDLARLIPRLTDLAPLMLQARELAHRYGASVCSLNTPHCSVPPEAWDLQFDAKGMGLLVVNPGGQAFALETSSIEQGRYVGACADCAARPWCHGMRDDYLRVHGESELHALTADQLALGRPQGSRLELPAVPRRGPVAGRLDPQGSGPDPAE